MLQGVNWNKLGIKFVIIYDIGDLSMQKVLIDVINVYRD